MPEMLKNKWQKAICKANCKAGPLVARAARRPVVVVPILEPSVRGYMRSREMTPMPAKGVRADVKMELLCTRMVMMQPMKMAM